MQDRGSGYQKRQNEVAAAIAIRPEDTIEADLAGGTKCGSDVAVRQGSQHSKGLALGSDHRAPSEHATQPFDVGDRPVRQIAQSALTHLTVLAIALAQQNGRR